MAAVKQSRQILAGYPVLNALSAEDEVTQISDFLVPAAGLGAGDIIEMGGMAEGMVFTSFKLVTEDLDSNGSPAVTLDGGILSGTYGDAVATGRTIGSEFFAAVTTGQAGGVQTETKAAGLLTAPSLDITPYGLKVVAAPATNIVGARIRTIVKMKSAPVQV